MRPSEPYLDQTTHKNTNDCVKASHVVREWSILLCSSQSNWLPLCSFAKLKMKNQLAHCQNGSFFLKMLALNSMKNIKHLLKDAAMDKSKANRLRLRMGIFLHFNRFQKRLIEYWALHLSMKRLVICSAFSMQINVNIPTHPKLDMHVANPDITTWLQSQAYLSSHVYTLNRMLRQAKQSAAQRAAITNQNCFPHDHRFHDWSSRSRPSTRSLLHIPTWDRLKLSRRFTGESVCL